MRRQQWALMILFAVLLAGVVIFSGCLPQTHSRPDDQTLAVPEQQGEQAGN